MEKENQAEVLKNNIDAQIEAKSTEAANAVKGELATAIEKQAVAQTEANQMLQKQLDEVKAIKAPAIIKSTKGRSELGEALSEKANEIASIKKGDSVVLDLKTFASSAGTASAVYGDERVSDIKYDPNFFNRVRNHLVTGTTAQTGAIRHSFETAETDSSAAKTKGSAQTQSSVTLTDVHTPIQTLYNLLTLPQEWLDDVDMIESYLSTRLMSNLMDVEDIQLLRGSGTSPNYSGLATGAVVFADNAARETYLGTFADSQALSTSVNEFDVITSIAAALANSNFVADKAFLNPIDYYLMTTRKSTTNEYVFHQAIDPVTGSMRVIWNGVELIKTAAQTSGTFTIIDSKSASQYWMREGSQIEFGMNDNDFATNSVSVRASIRGALVNYKQNGIVSDTFANFRTAIGTA